MIHSQGGSYSIPGSKLLAFSGGDDLTDLPGWLSRETPKYATFLGFVFLGEATKGRELDIVGIAGSLVRGGAGSGGEKGGHESGGCGMVRDVGDWLWGGKAESQVSKVFWPEQQDT